MAMQPFKMLVGDMVNEKQKGLAYSIELPVQRRLVRRLSRTYHPCAFREQPGSRRQVPPTVTFAFYLGALILLLCVLYTFAKVKEMPPKLYAEYNGVPEETNEKKGNMFTQMAGALKTAPAVVLDHRPRSVLLLERLPSSWTYSTDAIAGHAFDCPAEQKVSGVEINGTTYSDKYLFADELLVIDDGRLTINGVNVNGNIIYPDSIKNAAGELVIKEGQIHYKDGVALLKPGDKLRQRGRCSRHRRGRDHPHRSRRNRNLTLDHHPRP